MSKALKSKAPELLNDLRDHVCIAVQELLSSTPEQATQVGREVADRMAAHWGGQQLYFPMGLSIRISERDRQLYKEFNGTNQSDLARKYECSLQWVYKIIRTVKAEEFAARQRPLFPD